MQRAKLVLSVAVASVIGIAAALADQNQNASIKSKFDAELGLGLERVSTDLTGRGSDSATVFSPQLEVGYGLTDVLDVRFAAKYSSMDLYDLGKDSKQTRLGVGARYWWFNETYFTPYAELLLNYYTVKQDLLDKSADTFGLAGEFGVAWHVADWAFIKLGLQGETYLMDAKPKFEGSELNLSYWSIGLGLGAGVQF